MRHLIALLGLGAVACSTLTEDPAAPHKADPLGTGLRLAQVQDPTSPDHHANSTNDVDVTSTVVTWLDSYDETMDGKSAGTLYVQDVGSTAAYAGIGIYEPNYVPASLKVLPGDVIDFLGPYAEETSIGSASFSSGTFLPQLSKPVGTYRYDYVPPPPVALSLPQLDGSGNNFANGRKWMGMIATVSNVVVAKANEDTSGRVTYLMGDATTGTIPLTACSISNELYALSPSQYPAGTKFKSVTGIVTWFFSFHIAPRTPSDLVVQ